MTPAAQVVHDECNILRALIKDPQVWDSAAMLAGVERLRYQVLLALGEPVCPPMDDVIRPKRGDLWPQN
jgi:hypothetical protein